MGGDLTLGGLHGRFIFKNNLKGTHTAVVTRDVELLGEGTQIVLPKQPSRGRVGGNPWISFQWLGTDDEPMSEPILLGRCNKL
jgi:hypothetical protein